MSMSCEVLLLEVMQLVCVFLNQKCVPLSACLASNTDPCPPVCFLSLYNCTSRKPSKAIQAPPLTGHQQLGRQLKEEEAAMISSASQSLFQIYYLGEVAVDRRVSKCVLPWITEEKKLMVEGMHFIWLTPGEVPAAGLWVNHWPRSHAVRLYPTTGYYG